MKWISVEDRLPPENQDVLLIHMISADPSSIFMGWWSDPWWFETAYYHTVKKGEIFSREIPTDQITHWQPLPEPPES